MKSWIVGYLAALVALGLLDALWLGLVSQDFYKARIGQLLLDRPAWTIAAVFYLIHAAGIVVFAAAPAPSSGSWTTAAIHGAFFGLCVYAAYDITNLATLRGWSMAVSLVDLAWGAAVTAVAATASFLAMRAVQTP